MARLYVGEQRFQDYESLAGARPHTLLDTSPDGRYVALQTTVYTDIEQERAAVWDTMTKKIAWAPDEARALSWTCGGSLLCVVSEHRTGGDERQPPIVSPLQSEIQTELALYRWPDRQPLDRCAIQLRMGWAVDVVANPRATLLGVVWQDQGESGIELFTLSDQTLRQRRRLRYRAKSPYLMGPYFTADGRRFLMTLCKPCWWARDYERPSKGGDLLAGWVIVFDTALKTYRQEELTTSVPKGWKPTDVDDAYTNEFIKVQPLEGDRFLLTFPSGETRQLGIEPSNQPD